MSVWSATRLSRAAEEAEADRPGWRSVFQQDHDRLLFSTPVRRLADKTQVWPMDENDGVRTRLTHSHEVANLARSIGSSIGLSPAGNPFDANLHTHVQPILAAIGLAHDLGNPPFGHQGEAAIGKWFAERSHWIFSHRDIARKESLDRPVDPALHAEFTKFDGNPQTLRLVARLQTHVKHVGLDLSAATLGALLKYPVSVENVDPDDPVRAKAGYFASETDVVAWIRSETGLSEGQRHPLTWIMEACDDIAYSVLDVDDVMKKRVVSPDDVLAILRHDERSKNSPSVLAAIDRFLSVQSAERDADVVRDIKINYLRALLIGELIDSASERFRQSAAAIMDRSHSKPLMEGVDLCEALKDIARRHAFLNPGVLRMEAMGAAALTSLMSFFWRAITERKDVKDIESKRTTAVAKYGWSLVSPNYIEEAIRGGAQGGESATMRYREMRLLTDMISGMTDSFALKLWEKTRELPE